MAVGDVNFRNTSDVTWFNTPNVFWIGSVQSQLNFLEVSSFDSVVGISADDSNDLADSGVLFIGTGGNVKADIINVGTVTFLNVPNGTWIYVRVKKVYATGTTASDIVVAF